MYQRDGDGKYIGDANIASHDGHLVIEAGLGICVFTNLNVKGGVVAEAGSGIKAGSVIEAGLGIEAGGVIRTEFRVFAGITMRVKRPTKKQMSIKCKRFEGGEIGHGILIETEPAKATCGRAK